MAAGFLPGSHKTIPPWRSSSRYRRLRPAKGWEGAITQETGTFASSRKVPGSLDVYKRQPYMLMYYASILVGLVLVTYIPAVSMALPTMAGLIK